jgi:hypothetical protein
MSKHRASSSEIVVPTKFEAPPVLLGSGEAKTDGESPATIDGGANGSGWEPSSIEIEDEREALALQNIASRFVFVDLGMIITSYNGLCDCRGVAAPGSSLAGGGPHDKMLGMGRGRPVKGLAGVPSGINNSMGGGDAANFICRKCNSPGHYASQCPNVGPTSKIAGYNALPSVSVATRKIVTSIEGIDMTRNTVLIHSVSV